MGKAAATWGNWGGLGFIVVGKFVLWWSVWRMWRGGFVLNCLECECWSLFVNLNWTLWGGGVFVVFGFLEWHWKFLIVENWNQLWMNKNRTVMNCGWIWICLKIEFDSLVIFYLIFFWLVDYLVHIVNCEYWLFWKMSVCFWWNLYWFGWKKKCVVWHFYLCLIFFWIVLLFVWKTFVENIYIELKHFCWSNIDWVLFFFAFASCLLFSHHCMTFLTPPLKKNIPFFAFVALCDKHNWVLFDFHWWNIFYWCKPHWGYLLLVVSGSLNPLHILGEISMLFEICTLLLLCSCWTLKKFS